MTRLSRRTLAEDNEAAKALNLGLGPKVEPPNVTQFNASERIAALEAALEEAERDVETQKGYVRSLTERVRFTQDLCDAAERRAEEAEGYLEDLRNNAAALEDEMKAAVRRAEAAEARFQEVRSINIEAIHGWQEAEARAEALGARATRLAFFAQKALGWPFGRGWRFGQQLNPEGPILRREEIEADIEAVLAATRGAQASDSPGEGPRLARESGYPGDPTSGGAGRQEGTQHG